MGAPPLAPLTAPLSISPAWVRTPPAITPLGAQFILVVEKEGVFRRLVEDKVWAARPCIVLTGCGVPDLATRALLRALADAMPTLPVYGLADSNPLCVGRGEGGGQSERGPFFRLSAHLPPPPPLPAASESSPCTASAPNPRPRRTCSTCPPCGGSGCARPRCPP